MVLSRAKIIISVIVLLGLTGMVFCQEQEAVSFTDFVNPFIGTGTFSGPSKWGRDGGTYPGAVVPWGMIQVSPETRLNRYPAGYHYEDDTIYFFSLYGHFSGYPNGSSGWPRFMPVSGSMNSERLQSGSKFSHQDESASPGYYSVYLKDSGIRAEMTATVRTGFLKLSFDNRVSHGIALYGAEMLELTENTSLKGRWGNLFCTIEFSEPVAETKKTDKDFYISFNDSKTVLIKFALSEVSLQGAEKNLKAELSHWDFEKAKNDAQALWNSELGRIRVEGGTRDQKIIFYSALYHSMLLPFINSDAGGFYRGSDGKIRQLEGKNYTGFSPWDTFRTLHPLLCLLRPSVQSDMIGSLLRIYDQTGRLPERPMTGNHAIPIIVDSYFKGITDFDINKAYAAMRLRLLEDSAMRPDRHEYIELGYVPAEIAESVTRTVEYAYNDWVLAKMAKHLGQTEDYDLLINRALNYRNLFNPSERLMRPRNRDRSWEELGGFKEGDSWNYSWFVPHNVRDLLNLMGGKEAFIEHLDRAFAEGHYIHDNEPALHYPYLFNFAAMPWKTQYWIREILEKYYKKEVGGIPGNDDLGSMSSWYVLSAIGIYPVCPGNPYYAIGSPLFDQILIYQENGQTFEIRVDNNKQQNFYIHSAALNVEVYDKNWISHTDLMNGGTLTLKMSPEPNPSWASIMESVPPSETTSESDFSISNFALSDSIAHAHQLLSASIDLKNNGALGTKEVRLFIDDEFISSEWIMLNKGATVKVTLPFRLYEPGSHKIRINSEDEKTLTILAKYSDQTDKFILDNLQISPLVKYGQAVNLNMTVMNITGYPDSVRILIDVDGLIADSLFIKLSPGEKKSVLHRIENLNPGLHSISVANFPAYPVKVYQYPLESMVLYLTFDEGHGAVAADESGFGNHARLIGNTKWVEGKYGKALQTGADGFAEIPLSPSLKISGQSLTMMVWFYPINEATKGEHFNRYADIFTQGDHNVLKLQSSSILSFMAGGWGRGQCYGPVPHDWNQNWHHLTGVADAGEIKLYIDGHLVDKQKTQGDISFSPFPWNLGRNAEFKQFRSVNGYIDEVRLFHKAMSEEDIKRVMNLNDN